MRNFNLLCAALYKIKKNAFLMQKFKKNVRVHIPHIEFSTLDYQTAVILFILNILTYVKVIIMRFKDVSCNSKKVL